MFKYREGDEVRLDNLQLDITLNAETVVTINMVKGVDCTLIHRPFNVGDDVEMKEVYTGEWGVGKKTTASDIQYISKCDPSFFRHKDSTWRGIKGS